MAILDLTLHILCCCSSLPFTSPLSYCLLRNVGLYPPAGPDAALDQNLRKLLERRSQCPGLKLSPDVMTIICVCYWPAAFWSQARKTGTNAVTGNDGSLSCSTQLSDRCSEETRSTTGVSWQFRLSHLNYIKCLNSWRRINGEWWLFTYCRTKKSKNWSPDRL